MDPFLLQLDITSQFQLLDVRREVKVHLLGSYIPKVAKSNFGTICKFRPLLLPQKLELP